MSYKDLTTQEAAEQLRNHDEADWSGRDGNEVIEPRDVLYWLDAFGDLDLAINCQGLPKDLPDDVVRKINNWDVLNGWTGKVDKTSCPVCECLLYDFDFKHDHVLVDKWGGHEQYPEYVSDPAGYYWDTTGDHYVMCQRCRDPPNFSRMAPEPTRREVRVFYGESDEYSRFTHDSGVVRWDFEWDMDDDKAIDLYNLRERDDGELISGRQIAAAFASGSSDRNAMMGRLGFERIHVKEIDQSVKGMRRFWRYAKDVLSGWAEINHGNEPTHPDLPFTYIIEGQHQAWVASEHAEKFTAELVWQSLREASDYDAAEEWREKHDELLSFDWEAA